jgi:capsid protein
MNAPTGLAETQDRLAAAELRMLEHQCRALESSLEVWDKFVSFDHDELLDGDGREVWSRIGLADPGSVAAAYTSEAGLESVRGIGRHLATKNEFAINGHENRVSYIVGQGHQYRVEALPGEEPPEELLDQVRAWLKNWVKANHWKRRQQETRQRIDRDGEAFLRFFPHTDGLLRVRFVEPEKIKTPDREQSNPRVKFGIGFDKDDAETPEVYFVDGEPIDAGEIQRRTENVDLASPRGLSLFYPVQGNLRRAEKYLINLSHMGASRAAIGWIEKHLRSTQAQVEGYVSGKADIKVTSAKGEDTSYQRLRPGTVKHVSKDTEYEWPPAPDFAKYVIALQAELRAIASRLVMPEFMLTSDASNANYSSTMVAEGPAVKMFERLQSSTIDEDEEVIERAVEHAATSGLLPADTLKVCRIVAEPPTVQTRNRLQDAQADQILFTNKVMGPDTFAARHGLDYQSEKEDIEENREDATGFGLPPMMGQLRTLPWACTDRASRSCGRDTRTPKMPAARSSSSLESVTCARTHGQGQPYGYGIASRMGITIGLCRCRLRGLLHSGCLFCDPLGAKTMKNDCATHP